MATSHVMPVADRPAFNSQATQDAFQLSERRVYRALGQPRTTQRYVSRKPCDEESLTLRVVELASQYGRYDYRRITALLQNEGWRVN
jgi:putative transposase